MAFEIGFQKQIRHGGRREAMMTEGILEGENLPYGGGFIPAREIGSSNPSRIFEGELAKSS
jgi:hypothetical protein